MTLLLIVAVTAAFQMLGHCCCAGKGQTGLPTGAAGGSIPLAEVVSSGSMQNQRRGDDVGGDRPGDATAAAPLAAPVPVASTTKAGQEQQEPAAAQQVDDSNFGIADGDGDEYEEF